MKKLRTSRKEEKLAHITGQGKAVGLSLRFNGPKLLSIKFQYNPNLGSGLAAEWKSVKLPADTETLAEFSDLLESAIAQTLDWYSNNGWELPL